jgi:Polysaccharide deacetylase
MRKYIIMAFAALVVAAPAIGKSPLAPGNLALPTITGQTVQDQVLTTDNGTWTNNPTVFTYRWQRCTRLAKCSYVAGATEASYKLTSGDVGFFMRSVVTARNADGAATGASHPTTIVKGLGVTVAGYYGLSFDDGPNATYTQPVLDKLMGTNLQTLTGLNTVPLHPTATFFLKGTSIRWNNNAVPSHPNLALEEVQDGMQVGNHTYNHMALAADQPPDPLHPVAPTDCTAYPLHYPNSPNTEQLPAGTECATNEVEDASIYIHLATNTWPTLFRPPYGYYDQSTLDLLAGLPSPYSGMALTGWSIDSEDWNGATVSQIVQTASGVTNGGIILLHDAQQTTVDAVPQIISTMWTKYHMLPGKLVNSGTWPGPFGWQPDYHVTAVAP